jgi:tRNA wybutosine-synthesizing protein 1
LEDLINNAFVEMEEKEGNNVLDLEDIGPAVVQSKLNAAQKALQDNSAPREMVTKLQRKALTKEGYKIIGSHSAVKLCRWTKNQLRGRGGCYKHSFYGITSYQCMEATPSLACANKCVFCWRHHKNPVGTDWRWKEDDPSRIVEDAVKYHVSMIHELKGLPGVQLERLQEAHTVKHCALSLVGEPIMYPRINEMLAELHNRKISSFLVTNAQFPERIEQLDPVTQLYVSIDAATKDSLKAIDRPLFKDFWERYIASLAALKRKLQRTVYRMTLVKSWNMNEVENYVQLIEAGVPGKAIKLNISVPVYLFIYFFI